MIFFGENFRHNIVLLLKGNNDRHYPPTSNTTKFTMCFNFNCSVISVMNIYPFNFTNDDIQVIILFKVTENSG